MFKIGWQGGTGCCAIGGTEAEEVLANSAEALITASVTVRPDPSASAVHTPNGIVNADITVNHRSGRTSPALRAIRATLLTSVFLSKAMTNVC